MTTGTEQLHPTVKLFIRADPELGCETQKQAVLRRLDELDETGHIDDYEVNVWTKEIRLAGPLEGTSYYRMVREHVEEFQGWADSEGVQLNSAFKIKSLDCEITDETYRILSLPCICLAVYEDDDLRGVYPHTDDETIRTVSTCLAELETRGQMRYAD
ncbi:MAG: HTH domain-containing protein [Halohasta sp.]